MPVGPNDPASAYPAAPTGSSSAGLPCWFDTSGTFTPGNTTIAEWEATTDGVATFIDAQVSDGDATLIEIVTTGTYTLNVEAYCSTELDADPTDANMTLALNDDEVGPLYNLTSHALVAPGTYVTLRLGCPVQLTAGDLIKTTIFAPTADLRLMDANFMLLRVA